MDFSVDREDQAFKAVRDSEALISDRGHSLGDDDLLYILRVRECGIPKRAESRRENYLSQRLLIAVERELSDRGVALWNDKLRSLALGERVIAYECHARRDVVDSGPLLAPEEAGILDAFESGGENAVDKSLAVVERLLGDGLESGGKLDFCQVKAHEEGVTSDCGHAVKHLRGLSSARAEDDLGKIL